MNYQYEVRITAKGKSKIMRFIGENADMNWEDTYHCMGLVIDGEPNQWEENGVTIGAISVPEMDWVEVVRIMIEDAGLMGDEAEAGLQEDKYISVVNA